MKFISLLENREAGKERTAFRPIREPSGLAWFTRRIPIPKGETYEALFARRILPVFEAIGETLGECGYLSRVELFARSVHLDAGLPGERIFRCRVAGNEYTGRISLFAGQIRTCECCRTILVSHRMIERHRINKFWGQAGANAARHFYAGFSKRIEQPDELRRRLEDRLQIEFSD